MKIPALPDTPRARRIVDVAVLGAWAAVTIFCVLHHEPFRDEAQKWLIARDAESIGEFFRFLPYDRAPMGWYLLLLPFAKLGAPYWSSAVVNWVVAFAAAAVLWLKAPLPRPVKLLFLFSYFMLYDVPTIARNYSLFTLLSFTALAAWPSRREHPWRFVLVLLAMMNTNYIAVNIATVLGFLFLLERLRHREPRGRTALLAGLLLLGGLGFIAQVFSGGAPGIDEVAHGQTLGNFLDGFIRIHFKWVKPWYLIPPLVLWALLFLGLLLRPAALLLAVGAIAPPAHVVWKGLVTRQYFTAILVGTLIALWLAALEPEHPWRSAFLRATAGKLALLRRAATWLLVLPFAFSVWFGVTEVAKEYRMRFTDGPAAAAFIKENGLADLRIMVFPDGNGITLLPYLPGKQILYLGATRWGSKSRGDKYTEMGQFTSYQTAVKRAFSHATGNRDFLLVLGREFPVPGSCRLRYKSDATQIIWDEAYFIYQCGPLAATSPR